MIRIQKLNKFFNKGKQNEIHVLNHIDLDLPSHGMVAIFGHSGCGKTTLLNTIGGLDRFHSGEILLDGQSVRSNTDEIRNRLIGYIFQNYNLNKNETCFENVANALRLCGVTDPQVIEERVMAALSNVDMARYRARTPDTLSGGQQQRIAIARAIVKNPRIILADEPTGNLDEANTVMIMDLLREIAKEHLVILVTHEARLVDYYCDRVIELRDGAVVSTRENTAHGYTTRDKNDIFLGELPHTQMISEHATVDYYGAPPAEPVRVRIVNNGGKLYVQINTEKARVLDEGSEVRLREGVFEERQQAQEQRSQFDMSRLPPVENGPFGRLFTVRSSIKSGFRANFSRKRKGKKLLLSCMVLFSAVLVLLSALFGTAFGKRIEADNSYNHNVFYVYTPDASVSDQLLAAKNDASTGIDALHLYEGWYPTGDEQISFVAGYFESFLASKQLTLNAVMLEQSLAADAKLLSGKKEGLTNTELLISSASADRLLEESTLGYLQSYDDLIGLITTGYYVDGENLRIAGVVQSSEPAIYLSERALSQAALRRQGLAIETADRYGKTVGVGETILLCSVQKNDAALPKVGDTVEIHGVPLRVADILRVYSEYSEWIKGNGIQIPDIDTWMTEEVARLYPSLSSDSDAYWEAMETVADQSYYKYQLEVYYAHIDAYLTEYTRLSGESIEAWLYDSKGITDFKYLFMEDTDLLYLASRFYDEQGRYPALSELSVPNEYTPLEELLSRYTETYKDVFYQQLNGRSRSEYCYLITQSDYTRIGQRTGKTTSTAFKDYLYVSEKGAAYESSASSQTLYTTVHSSNPAATAAFLEATFPDLTAPLEEIPAILTPDTIREGIISEQWGAILSRLIAMVSLLAVLCVCMYFIMRASLLSRIKEIGIYRAIGVTKRNLKGRFLIESLVLSALTVFVGFLGASLLLKFWLSLTPLMSELFYYPLWLAAILLVVLLAVCILCGILPVLALLRKSPSEILAKYDI